MRYSPFFIIFSYCLILNSAYAQNYAVSNISEVLLNNANAVIREHSEEFTIISKKETRLKGRMVVTLLNDKAKTFGYIVLPYDKFSKVEKIKATIYDENGTAEVKMKQSDLLDISAISNFSIYEDNRVKLYNPQFTRYPYTLEYEYQYTYKGSLFYPDWEPQPGENISVEKSNFKVISSPALPFRYKVMNTSKPDSAQVDDKWVYTWELTNAIAKEEEAFSADISHSVPSVLTAPIDFELDGYDGNMNTWVNFSKWIIELNKDKNQLDPQTEADLKKLINPNDDVVTKVREVYTYLQSKTRYVSIQLGIGGFQPFAANVVGEKGYGDCKALSNYTKAMLDNLGIKSHYTLVRAGEGADEVLKDFPSSQFNHAFLCVPLQKDTIWLECTSQSNPFGYLGSFTGDRNVLLITENGGKMVKTPHYKKDDNTQIRKAVVSLEETGNATVKMRTDYRGLQYENGNLHFMLDASLEEQKKWLYKKLELSNFTINQFQFATQKERIPSAVETLDLTLRNYSSKSGKRLFLQPNLLNKLSWDVPTYESRKSDIVLKTPFMDIDTIEFNLPAKFYPEFLPEKKEFITEFGQYYAEIIATEKKLLYIRKFISNKGTFPKEKYAKFAEFIRKVKSADNLKLVFVDKT